MPNVEKIIAPSQLPAGPTRTPIVGNSHKGSSCIADGQGEMLWFTYHDGWIRCFATTTGARSILLVNDSVSERSVVPTPALDSAGAQVGVTRSDDGGLWLSIIGRKTANSLSFRAIYVDSSSLSDGSGPWVHYSTVEEDLDAPYGSAFDEGCRANASEIVMSGSTWFLAGHYWHPDSQVPRWACDGMVSTDGGLSWSRATDLYNGILPSEGVSRQFAHHDGAWTWSVIRNGSPVVRASSDLQSWSALPAVSGLTDVYDCYQIPVVGGGVAMVEVNRHNPQLRSLYGMYGGESLSAPEFAFQTMAGNHGIEVASLTWMSVAFASKCWPWYADTGDGQWVVSNSAGSVRALPRGGGWHVGEHQIRIG